MLRHLFFALCLALCYSCDFPQEITTTINGEVTDGVLASFYPHFVKEEGTVDFQGTVFYPNMPDVAITFNGVRATNISTATGSASAVVPKGATTGKIVVTINGKEHSFEDKIYIWNKIAVLPGGNRYSHASFLLNGTPYAGLGANVSDSKVLWQYNPSNNTWNSRASLTSLTGATEAFVGFAVDGKGYFLGSGYGVPLGLWEYNPTNNFWTKRNGFTTSDRRSMGAAVSSNNRVYVGMGRDGWSSSYTAYKDFWEYNPTNNTWTKKADIPIGRVEPEMVAVGTKIYAGLGVSGGSSARDWWEYDVPTNTWKRKADLTDYTENVVNLNGKIYGVRSGSSIYQYDPIQDTWSFFLSMPFDTYPTFARVIPINNTFTVISGTNAWKVNL